MTTGWLDPDHMTEYKSIFTSEKNVGFKKVTEVLFLLQSDWLTVEKCVLWVLWDAANNILIYLQKIIKFHKQ